MHANGNLKNRLKGVCGYYEGQPPSVCPAAVIKQNRQLACSHSINVFGTHQKGQQATTEINIRYALNVECWRLIICHVWLQAGRLLHP